MNCLRIHIVIQSIGFIVLSILLMIQVQKQVPEIISVDFKEPQSLFSMGVHHKFCLPIGIDALKGSLKAKKRIGTNHSYIEYLCAVTSDNHERLDNTLELKLMKIHYDKKHVAILISDKH